ncbi:MAG: hypothetical protein L3K11_00930, partial [Thermoplasmata archaeon]|nr:hypothetical protein [Thermoplasmata archaeon]
LYLEGMSTPVVVGNTFHNDNISIDANGPVEAQIYHNDFVAVQKWVLLGAPILAWDNGYPSGGNYWSNYTGGDRFRGVSQDTPGADGIGDTPMVVNATEADRYPLMTPWSDHRALFVETGLPLGMSWTVVLNGSSYESQSNTLSVASMVGADSPYSFTIPSVEAFAASPSSGSGVLGAGLVVVNVTFARPTYALAFSENGLPAGTTWTVEVNGTPSTGNATTLTLALPNGSYAYSVVSLPGFTDTPRTGSFTVHGAGQSVAVSFVAFTYAVHVVETGLTVGKPWSITLGGSTSSVSNGSLNLELANGSYAFQVGAPSGFNATPSAGSWTVSGGPVTVYIGFAPSSSGSPGSPGGHSLTQSAQDALPYLLAIALLAIGATIGWVLALRRRGVRAGSDAIPPATPPTPPSGAK